jgi:uncharacterized membrane protein
MGLPIGLPAMIGQQSVQVWQGQFPPPEAVEKYEGVLPGSFDRMIKMAENLQAAQIEETRRAQEYTRDDSRRGHWLAFAAVALATVGAVVTATIGQPWVAAALVGIPVMGVAKALVDSVKRPSPADIVRAVGDGASVPEPPTPSPPTAPSA